MTSELTSHIGYHLRMVSNAVSQSFAKKLSESGVTVAEWVILRELFSGDEKTSPSALSEMTGLTRGAVSKLIDRLIRKNFIVRAEFAGDRRFQEIRLTPAGKKIVPKLATLADQNDDHFFGGLSVSEKSTLTKILKKLEALHELKTNPIE